MSQSLKKGIEALIFLAKRQSVGVTELAEKLEVHKSTAFRILDTLMETNIVEKNPDTLKYKLGPAILQLSDRYYRNFNVIESAAPIMKRLASDIRESVHLCVLSNNSAVVVEQVMSESRLVVNAKIGNAEPLYCSSVGKCLLAFSPEKTRSEILESIDFRIYTDNTIKDKEALERELEKIRAAGYATDNEELSENIICVAVPVLDRYGDCKFSLGASGAASRMTPEKLERVVPLMLKAAKDIFE